MNRVGAFIERHIPLMAKLCAIGVVLVIIGEVVGVPAIRTFGGVLTAPLTLLCALACLAVVLLAPAWPLAAISGKIPRAARVPFLAAAAAVVVGWWALWAFIATGALASY